MVFVLHSHILPEMAKTHAHDNDFDASWFATARDAVIFDCRHLDIEFVKDTGAAALEEKRLRQEPVYLPHPCCYFEFERTGILAQTCQQLGQAPDPFGSGPLLGETVSFHPFVWNAIGEMIDGIDRETYDLGIPNGTFPNGTFSKMWGDEVEVGSEEDWSLEYGDCHDRDVPYIQDGAAVLSGVLTLLDERLVASEYRPDPEPQQSAARIRRGKLPLTSETHVLTLNMARLRRLAMKPVGSHETPRLHWRRGHWRVLHRFSEFESRIWVSRALVGDPNRGYVSKNYRLEWHVPMLSPSGKELA